MKNFIKKNKFIIFLFSLAFIIRLIYILIANTPIISDFKTMYDASQELINGTTNYKGMPYFTLWGYQMGHVIYQALLLSICNSVIFLKIINCLITSLTVVMIYLLCNKVATKKSSKICSITYALFPFPLFMNSVLSNQQLPLLLILIAIYLFIKLDYRQFIMKALLIGVLLGISNILRSETIVIIGAIFIYTLLSLKKNLWKKPLVCFFVILITYLTIFEGTSSFLKITNISPSGLKNLNPAWKFVTGLNYDTKGTYSEEDAANYAPYYELSKKEAINRLKKIDKLPNLFISKINTLWLKSNLYWPLGHIKYTKNNTYNNLTIINQYFIWFFTIISLISLIKVFKFNTLHTLCFIILLIYFGIYLFIEVMPRYAYNLQVFEVILSSIGLDIIINFKRKYYNKK